jgi:Ca-activated chloride channel homolog
MMGRPAATRKGTTTANNEDHDVIRVNTNLVTIPVRILTADGKPVGRVRQSEFKIYENGVEQEVAYFSDAEQPFTVALVLDMSYSSVFKLDDIQWAARIFTLKLRPDDKVSVVSFDEKPHVLCEPTNDRRILQLAINGSRIASGTSVYDTLDDVFDKLSSTGGRKAIVLLSDGVDTTSALSTAAEVANRFAGEDVIVYPIQYNTFTDVQKSRDKDAEVRFDEDDRPYVVKSAPKKGERSQDYETAHAFLRSISEQTGGRVYEVSSTTNLNDAFSQIAEELRRIYSVGYYPAEDRKSGAVYDIKVRVYRPNLKITARNHYHGK